MMFMDLIMYMARKKVYNMGKAQGKDYKLFANEDFSKLSDPSFKFIALSSFKAKKELPMSLQFSSVQKICDADTEKNMNLVMRCGEDHPAHWSAEELQTLVPPTAKKIFIIGPENFVADITEKLNALHFNPAIITYI
jgi:hypothetical protein